MVLTKDPHLPLSFSCTSTTISTITASNRHRAITPNTTARRVHWGFFWGLKWIENAAYNISFNSLWLSHAIWWRRYGSSLVQYYDKEDPLGFLLGPWLLKMLLYLQFTSLWPGDAIWQQSLGSILAQVMACCLAAPRHYINQWWLIINKVTITWGQFQ